MKDMVLTLLLLCARTLKVWSEPYKPVNGECHNKTTEYLHEGLCCKKCLPGYRRNKECTETTDTVCEPCPADQYQENFNFSPNCQLCLQCKPGKGLQNVQNCSPTTKSVCACLPGRFCVLQHSTYCSDCKRYRICKAGSGVSVQGTLKSDVKCAACPEGTFSDTASSTDRCRPHTDCSGMAALRKGNATSDAVCESSSTVNLQAETALTPASRSTSATPSSRSTAPLKSTVQSVQPSTSEEPCTHLTESPPLLPYSKPVGVITGITGFLVIIIIFILIWLCLHKKKCKQDATRLQDTEVDANGNCKTADDKCIVKPPIASFTVKSQEDQHLLEKREPSSNHSQWTAQTESLTRTEIEVDPLQSTLALDNLSSNLSEPTPLMSTIEPTVSQPSIQTQTSSQPSSPQIITPVTTSPHVNVNITLHIGNGSCRTPTFIPTDLMPADNKLPFGEEEESFSTPQQEDGKQSLMSVQESSSYCTEHSDLQSYP